MNFQTSVKTVLSKFAVFDGRASRSELWWWILALALVGTVTSLIDGVLVAPILGFERFSPEAGEPLQMLFTIVIFLPTLAVEVRRLHDIDRSGWWVLLGLVPIIGGLVLLWWYTRPSTDGDNQYGPSPHAVSPVSD